MLLLSKLTDTYCYGGAAAATRGEKTKNKLLCWSVVGRNGNQNPKQTAAPPCCCMQPTSIHSSFAHAHAPQQAEPAPERLQVHVGSRTQYSIIPSFGEGYSQGRSERRLKLCLSSRTSGVAGGSKDARRSDNIPRYRTDEAYEHGAGCSLEEPAERGPPSLCRALLAMVPSICC